MNDYTAHLSKRFDPDRQLQTSGLLLLPQRWMATDRGGPVEAEIAVIGSRDTIHDVFDWLGCGVEIVNPEGLRVWSGLVQAADINYGQLAYSIDLADVANRVRAAYTGYTAGGQVDGFVSDWLEDEFSQAAYGIRERTESMDGYNDAISATSYLQARLDANALPSATSDSGDGTYTAVLRCQGLVSELGHRYHEDYGGRTEYDPGTGIAHAIGWELAETTNGFSAYGDDPGVGGYSSFGATLPPIQPGSQFKVAGSNHNDGEYTLVEVVADTIQTLSTPADGARFRWDSGGTYLVEEATEQLGFLSVGQQFDIDITTSSQKPDGSYVGFEAPPNEGPGYAYLPDWPFEGLFNVRESGSERVKCAWDETRNDDPLTEGINDGFDQGNVDDHPFLLDGTLTAAAFATVTPAPAAEELNAGSTITVTTSGWRVDQPVTIEDDGGGYLWKIGIRVARVGTPVDTLRVSLWTDSGGAVGFGTLVDEGWISPSDVGTELEMVWAIMDNAGANAITDSGAYRIVIERTGSADDANYWLLDMIDQTDDLYEKTARFWNGSIWADRPTPVSIPFRIWTGTDTTQLAMEIIDQYRLRIDGVDAAESSGVLANRHDDTGRTALDVVHHLLDLGTADGLGLVLQLVDPRRLLIKKKPAEQSNSNQLAINLDRHPEWKPGAQLSPGQLVVGVWADEAGAPPQPSAVMPLQPRYISWMEYNASAGRYDYGTAEADDLLDVGVADG